MGERDQRAGIVEQVDEQEGEDHGHQPDLQRAGEVHLQEDRRDRGRHVERCRRTSAGRRRSTTTVTARMPMITPPMHLAVLERHDQREAQRRHQRPASS